MLREELRDMDDVLGGHGLVEIDDESRHSEVVGDVLGVDFGGAVEDKTHVIRVGGKQAAAQIRWEIDGGDLDAMLVARAEAGQILGPDSPAQKVSRERAIFILQEAFLLDDLPVEDFDATRESSDGNQCGSDFHDAHLER
jgi:hypothetical protein